MISPIYDNQGKAWIYLARLINWTLMDVDERGYELKQATMLEF